ncbi:serine/threonine-protein kinase [Streptomyces sp. NPDC047974]|uniref:serine/threonine-protein kinase n=1 Tax=Streptomyces sp. NPDC047974 TaxID=3154343 RepID=UPI0033FE6F7B
MTRRDHGRPAPVLLRLPAALARRFVVVRELPHQGREADVLLVRDTAGGEFVAKVYRSGVRVEPGVWERLRGLDSRHVARLIETGFSDGRDFEVSEYLSGGSLEDLAATGTPVSAPVLTAAVSQLTEAVALLHRAGVVHGDLKPSNVLLRRREPLELALVDFGVSKSLDATSRFTQRVFGTLAYSPPEYVLGAEVSAAQDWWAVGLIARRLATGRAPFEGLSEQAVRHHLATRPVDVADVSDARVRLLCAGLLVRDPGRRWGVDEVRRWLEGGTPEVAEGSLPPAALPGTTTGRRPLQFNGVKYTEKAELARALATDWETAARRFFALMGDPGDPGQGWRQLRGWLAQFEDPEHDRLEELADLADVHLPGGDAPDVKLLRLLHWLDPTLPPLYRGERVLPEDLLALAERASSAQEDERRTARERVEELYTQDLLPTLATFGEGADRLAGVHQRWRDLNDRWDVLRRSTALPSRIREELGASGILVEALAIAVAPAWARALRVRVEASAASVRGATGWFDTLLADDGDPVRHLAAARTLPAAAAEVRRLEELRHARRAAEAADRRAWQEAEHDRRSGSRQAVLRAFGGVALLALLPFGLPLVLGAVIGDEEFLPRFVPAATVTFGVPLVCELLLAVRLGRDYHPHWSLHSRLAGVRRRLPGSRGMLATQVRTMRKSTIACGGGCLLYLALATLIWLIVTLKVWSPIPLLVAAGYGTWTAVRYRGWRSAHRSRPTPAMEER